MVKTLLILRHAKSSWKEPGLSDHDRPLNKRGRNDVPKMGRLIRRKKLKPQLILCSGAKRARETVELITQVCGYRHEIRFSEALYAAGPEAYIKLLYALDDAYDCVMVAGHNPGLEELLERLTGEEHRLPTAALAQVELPIEKWRELGDSVNGGLTDLWSPRQFPE
jgi:phosphohistidine phosphatase